MSEQDLHALFQRADLPGADVVTVLEVVSLVDRMEDGKVINCPSTVSTALTWSSSQPDMVNLVRRDLLEEGEDDLWGAPPSFYWHTFPIDLLRRAVVTEFDEFLLHPSGYDMDRAVTISPHESAPGWITIGENDALAEGYVGLRFPEPHEHINVSVERITDFLTATWGGAR